MAAGLLNLQCGRLVAQSLSPRLHSPRQCAGARACPVTCSSSNPSGHTPSASGPWHGACRPDLIEEWKALRPRPSLGDSSGVSTSGRDSSSGLTGAARGYSSLEDSWDLDDGGYTPLSSNLPTAPAHGEAWRGGSGGGSAAPSGFDKQSYELWQYTNSLHYSTADAGDLWRTLTNVHVILFGVGDFETEGIYSLRALRREDNLPQDTIIAFEDDDDAVRYAGLLEATMVHKPHVCPITPQELLEFCREAGYSCRLEPRGTLLIPPDHNVGLTDWERSLRLREGQFSVLARDPVERQPGPALFSAPEYQGPTNNAGAYTPPVPSSLEEAKALLERCLPRDK
ncbi:hypothetical protein WJX81_004326 [Elliptochloris bilobata]|uniref:Uncharacterized protein n=1 Tax=Elliptochloris bilobata TaxID=381761 RepID=A0AAW1RY49_9CHLO